MRLFRGRYLTTIGTIGLIIGILFLIGGIYYLANPVDRSTQNGVEVEVDNSTTGEMYATCCAPLFLGVSALLIHLGRRKRKEEEESIKEIAGLLKLYRRCSISDISSKVGIPNEKLHQLMLKGLDNGAIEGYFHPKTDEFVTPEASEFDVDGWICHHCNHVNDRSYLPGEAAKCDRCGWFRS